MMQPQYFVALLHCLLIESVVYFTLALLWLLRRSTTVPEVALSVHHDAQINCRQVYVNRAGAVLQAINSVVYKHVRRAYAQCRGQCSHSSVSNFLVATRQYCVLGVVEDSARFAVQGGPSEVLEVEQQGLGGDEGCVVAAQPGEVAPACVGSKHSVERQMRVLGVSPEC